MQISQVIFFVTYVVLSKDSNTLSVTLRSFIVWFLDSLKVGLPGAKFEKKLLKYGMGAEVTVQSKYVHPNQCVKKVVGTDNIVNNHVIQKAAFKRTEVLHLQSKQQLCYASFWCIRIFWSNDDGEIAKIYTEPGNCTKRKDGYSNKFLKQADRAWGQIVLAVVVLVV